MNCERIRHFPFRTSPGNVLCVANNTFYLLEFHVTFRHVYLPSRSLNLAMIRLFADAQNEIAFQRDIACFFPAKFASRINSTLACVHASKLAKQTPGKFLIYKAILTREISTRRSAFFDICHLSPKGRGGLRDPQGALKFEGSTRANFSENYVCQNENMTRHCVALFSGRVAFCLPLSADFFS